MTAEELLLCRRERINPSNLPHVVNKPPKPSPIKRPIDGALIALLKPPTPEQSRVGNAGVPIDHSRALQRLLLIVADALAMDPEQLIKSSNRAVPLVAARTVFCWVARYYVGASYPQIGAALRQDHTSAITAVARCRQWAAEYRLAVTRVIGRMNAAGEAGKG